MISHFHSIILGIVEGITEFLPISSTGHLILTSHLLKIENTNLLKDFQIIIQLGAILAVIVFYFKELFNLEVIKKLIVAFLPTGIIGLTIYKFLKEYLLDNYLIVIISLFVGGVVMILIEKNKKIVKENAENKFNIKEITYKKAFYLGLWQSIAMIPGVSRSGATIIGGLLMDLKRETIVKFSFLLAVPTMLAATGYDLLKSYKDISFSEINSIAIGFITSFIFALIFIKWLINYVQRHNFIAFGWYRIIISIIFALVFFM
ncbi:MAG: undecaprenyl-diphosphate phosphatase [Candidatus Paceibacterota bacterium]|jgi:undecaprenyl-diphosphatase